MGSVLQAKTLKRLCLRVSLVFCDNMVALLAGSPVQRTSCVGAVKEAIQLIKRVLLPFWTQQDSLRSNKNTFKEKRTCSETIS